MLFNIMSDLETEFQQRERELVGAFIFAQSTTTDYIRAEGDFHEVIYIVQRTNEAEIRPEEQSEKAESCRKNLWNEIQSKGAYRQKRTHEQNQKEWASSVGLCQT